MEIKEVIQLLNELYQQSQKAALSPVELAKRDQLRQQYLGLIRSQVKASLDQVQIVENGTHEESNRCNCKGNCPHR